MLSPIKTQFPWRSGLKLLILLVGLSPIALSAYFSHNPLPRPIMLTYPSEQEVAVRDDVPLGIRMDREVYRTDDREIGFQLYNKYEGGGRGCDYPELEVQIDGIRYRLARWEWDDRFVRKISMDGQSTSTWLFPVYLYCDELPPARYRLVSYTSVPVQSKGATITAEFEVSRA